jgi:hypothetical protein
MALIGVVKEACSEDVALFQSFQQSGSWFLDVMLLLLLQLLLLLAEDAVVNAMTHGTAPDGGGESTEQIEALTLLPDTND